MVVFLVSGDTSKPSQLFPTELTVMQTPFRLIDAPRWGALNTSGVSTRSTPSAFETTVVVSSVIPVNTAPH
ncbi:MAG: hypothetical protein WB770_12265, partial [Acidimicrobiales bacterium]